MVDKLGDWARTHTCGELRASDVGRDVLLLGWVHKIRDLGHLVFLDLRDRDGLTQVVFDAQALRDRAKQLRSEFVIGVKGRVAAAGRRGGQRADADRGDRGRGRRAEGAERGPGPAVRHRGRGGRLRRAAAPVPVPRPAAPRAAGQPGPPSPRDDGGAEVLRQQGILGDRDAGAHQVHARGGARLPGAEPRASRRVLRAPAVAADLQADPDDRRHGPLLPDRQVLPRRGPARRPAAGVHPDRRRDVLRDARSRHGDRRAAHAAGSRRDRARDRCARSPG